MNWNPPFPLRGRLLVLALAAAHLSKGADPSPVAATSPQTGAGKRPATTEETVVLNPFEVVADASDSYDATNTNSITGTSLSLNKTPLDAKIFNRTIIDELGVVDVARLLSDFGGLGPPLLGSGSEDQRGMLEGDGLDYKTMTTRGLTISNPRRDGFLRSDTSLMDSFDVESAEAMQGSNSLLFGSGDAGGVVNINSKRARLNRQAATFSAKWDSEGTTRYTTDINAGSRQFALRINHLKGEERYFRPILGLEQEGLHTTATVKPLKWLTAYGEYRYFRKDHIRAGSATIRTPTTMRLTTGETMDNQSVRYITGLGGSELLNNYITLRNQDSISGAFLRHHYVVNSYAANLEANASRDLHFQFRYGRDKRVNENVSPSSQVLYHPDATGNLYVDAKGQRQWATNTSPTATPNTLAADGYKLTGVWHHNFGRWGDHWLNAFIAQQNSGTTTYQWRYFETDASGKTIQGSLTSTNSGQVIMPAAWIPAFPETLFGQSWPADTVVHPNGKTYKFAPLVYPGAVPPTAGNPLGLSGPIPAAGGRPSGYSHQDTHERTKAFSLSSEFWGGRINTMAGFRFESADTVDTSTGLAVAPIDYHTSTTGVVFDTPVKGIRGYASYATNARVTFGTETAVDIFERPLPLGEGVSREAGLKFSMWDHRLSGNVAYYLSEAKNFPATLASGTRDNIDPAGINGRNGGTAYAYSKKSDGIDVALSMRPLKPWQVTLNYAQANGSERDDVTLPVLYNDEFNTTTVSGQTVVAVKNATTGVLTPLMVPGDPKVPSSAQTPLSLTMLKDRTSPYFALLDADSGQLLNASALGLATAGVGTNRTGLAISNHQLGFVPPTPEIIVRRAGERTTGYPERSFSLINRYQVGEGRFRGTVLGVATVYQVAIRGYMYTDAAAAGERKVFNYPDRFENSFFAKYAFKLGGGLRATVQVNVANLFDKQTIVALPRSTTGATRYFSYQYSPRKLAVTTSVNF